MPAAAGQPEGDQPAPLGQVEQDPAEGGVGLGGGLEPALARPSHRRIVHAGIRQPGVEPGREARAARRADHALAPALVHGGSVGQPTGGPGWGATSLGPVVSSTQVKISVPSNHLMPLLLGERDEVLRAVEAAFPEVGIHVRGNEIALEGDADVERVAGLLEDLVVLVEQGHRLDAGTVRRSVEMVRQDERPAEVLSTEVLRPPRGRPVRPKSCGPEALRRRHPRERHHLRGRAGRHRQELAGGGHGRARAAGQGGRPHHPHPARGRGRRAARLPARRPHGQGRSRTCARCGTRSTTWSAPRTPSKLLERGAVEVAPLAFMRGRTLNSSFIILDEAQNTTPEQMKMFLTRIGFGSKAVVTGDTTQVDVAGGRSGLGGLERILGDIDGLAWVHLTSSDVVRHRIVQDIVDAYERAQPAEPTR